MSSRLSLTSFTIGSFIMSLYVTFWIGRNLDILCVLVASVAIIQCVSIILSFIFLWVATEICSYFFCFQTLNHYFCDLPFSLTNLFICIIQLPPKVLAKYIFLNAFFVFISCCGYWGNIFSVNRMIFQAMMLI